MFIKVRFFYTNVYILYIYIKLDIYWIKNWDQKRDERCFAIPPTKTGKYLPNFVYNVISKDSPTFLPRIRFHLSCLYSR